VAGQWRQSAATAKDAITKQRQTTKSVATSSWDPIAESYEQGGWDAAIGRGLVSGAGAVIGGKGLTKLGKAGNATPNAPGRAPDTTKAGSAAPRPTFTASDGTEIVGFTRHGINRAIGDGAKRAGVRPEALLDTIKNPTNITGGVDDLGRPFKVYTGTNARVVINPETGRIVSVNPRTGAGANR